MCELLHPIFIWLTDLPLRFLHKSVLVLGLLVSGKRIATADPHLHLASPLLMRAPLLQSQRNYKQCFKCPIGGQAIGKLLNSSAYTMNTKMNYHLSITVFLPEDAECVISKLQKLDGDSNIKVVQYCKGKICLL